MSGARNTTSRATMRRRVAEAGGGYSRQCGCWILPGIRHNCAPAAVEARWCSSLEEAYEVCAEHAARVAQVMRAGQREAAFLRANS